MQIDASLRGKLPQVDPPALFTSQEGRHKGWKVTIPGHRPIATPAVVEGKVFLGGGFGSYDFYAFDADTGNVVWQYQTTDDGPTAAVVEDGYVVFNTESCELEVLTVAGRSVWKKWLGDPLMSMPAISQGRIYQAYPNTRGDRQHYLACFDLATGTEHWKQPIAGEVITAPVIANGHVYLATLGGLMYCFRKDDGQPVWQEEKNATSSPVVWDQECYFSQRKEVLLGMAGKQQTEHMAARGLHAHSPTRAYAATSMHADYLDFEKRKARSPRYSDYEKHEAAVGFGFHKGDAKMDQAMRNLGHGQVSGIWAYQGSKPFISHGKMFSSIGDTIHCADLKSEVVFWKKRLHEPKENGELLDSVLTPPAIANGKLFIGTIFGDVHCLSQESGEVLWTVSVGEPIIFQPAVARGRVYVPTNAGSLVCIETGDANDDGWLMWGANAAHNGRE